MNSMEDVREETINEETIDYARLVDLHGTMRTRIKQTVSTNKPK